MAYRSPDQSAWVQLPLQGLPQRASLPGNDQAGTNPTYVCRLAREPDVFHVNDPGFWMFKEYFNLTMKQTILSWSIWNHCGSSRSPGCFALKSFRLKSGPQHVFLRVVRPGGHATPRRGHEEVEKGL